MNWFKHSWLKYEQKSRQRIVGGESFQTEKIEQWRDEFFVKIFLVTIPALILPTLAGFIMSLIDGLYFLAFVGIMALCSYSYIFFSKNMRLRLRKTIFLITLYTVGFFIFVFVGVSGMAYLLGVSTFSAIILSRKAGCVSLFINFILLQLFVVLMTFPFFKDFLVFKNSVGSIVAVGANFIVFNFLLVNSVSSLIKTLQVSQDKEQRHLSKLEKETKAHKRARLRAEESDLLKSSFLNNMSQEVRTPVNRIIDFVDCLEKPNLSEKDKDLYISSIKEGCNRLTSMIGDLITVSTIETGQFEIVSSNFSVNEFIREIYLENKAAVKDKNIKFSMHVDVECDDACMIYTDRDKFKLVVQKLLDNAIKFTDKGEITIAYEKKDDELEFYIKDSGVGIPLELQKDIFKNFRQGEIDTSRRYEGNGLGLGIAKGYIEELGGLIGLSSSLDKGSVFYFSFPVN